MAATKGKTSISKEQLRKQKLDRRSGKPKKSYALAQAKAHFSEIVDHVQSTGEEVVVTRHGKPVVRLVPDRGAGPRLLGFARGRVEFNAGWDQPLSYKDLFGE